MAAYLGYTLRMKTFRGRPVMVHNTHTRRRRLDVEQTGCDDHYDSSCRG